MEGLMGAAKEAMGGGEAMGVACLTSAGGYTSAVENMHENETRAAYDRALAAHNLDTAALRHKVTLLRVWVRVGVLFIRVRTRATPCPRSCDCCS